MNRTRFVAIAALIFSLIAASTLWNARPAFSEEDKDVDFGANIEFIRGHLEQAVSNKQAGNLTLAAAHTSHPIAEVYSLIEEEIAEHDSALNTQLKGELDQLATLVQSSTTADFEAKVTAINGLLDKAIQSVISDTRRADPKFSALVAMSLLETAEHEYEEGVLGGQVVEMIEYQDGTAFISRAKATFESVQSKLPEEEAHEIEVFFGQLDSAAKSKADPAQVETLIGGIIHEFEEALGIEAEGPAQGNWTYIDTIKDLLDESVAEYKAGNTQKARALAVEAYLENYEYIEADIETDNADLKNKIEVDMRDELKKMIDEGRPAAEIESHVAEIKTDLETARAIVTPEFPVIIAVVASAMAGLVAIVRLRGLALPSRPL